MIFFEDEVCEFEVKSRWIKRDSKKVLKTHEVPKWKKVLLATRSLLSLFLFFLSLFCNSLFSFNFSFSFLLFLFSPFFYLFIFFLELWEKSWLFICLVIYLLEPSLECLIVHFLSILKRKEKKTWDFTVRTQLALNSNTRKSWYK